MLDRVGTISTRHLLWADRSRDGLLSASCMMLAKAQ